MGLATELVNRFKSVFGTEAIGVILGAVLTVVLAKLPDLNW
jgi:hypothetical protein